MVDPEAVQIWGRPNYDGSSRHRWAQVHWDEIEEPEELAEAAAEWLKEHNHEYATYEAEVVDRSMEPGRSHESIRLGTAGHIIDDSFRPPIEVRVRVIALEVNVNDRTQVKITLGNFTPSALETVSNVDKELQRKVSKGAPITLLDTTVQTTKDRLRRSRGYKYESETMGTISSDGPYGDPETQCYVQVKGGIIALADRWDPVAGEPDWRTGITGSGISADMITTGTLNAELVNIESVNEVGSRLIRMNNGELHTYTNDVENNEGRRLLRANLRSWRL